MTSKPNIWAVIPAAGTGSRIGGGIPKQYLSLNDRMLIEHTLARLGLSPLITGIVVAISRHDQHWQTVALPQDIPIIKVEGGAERHHSVLNGLLKLADTIPGNDWVMVHDAARPCVRHDDIDKLINAVITHPVGGILGVPVSDTMKRVNAANQIIDTVSRTGLWHAQTPQIFRLNQLIDAIQYAVKINAPITDEASAMELKGFTPLIVEGHKDNIKITEAQDLITATMYLERQAQQVML